MWTCVKDFYDQSEDDDKGGDGGGWLSTVLYMKQNETVVVAMMMLATHSIRNMQPRQRKHPKRETQGLKYLNAGRQP